MTSVSLLLFIPVVKMSYVWQQGEMWQLCSSLTTLSATTHPSKLFQVIRSPTLFPLPQPASIRQFIIFSLVLISWKMHATSLHGQKISVTYPRSLRTPRAKLRYPKTIDRAWRNMGESRHILVTWQRSRLVFIPFLYGFVQTTSYICLWVIKNVCQRRQKMLTCRFNSLICRNVCVRQNKHSCTFTLWEEFA